MVCSGLASACSKPRVEIPADIIQPDSMVVIMADIHLAEAVIQSRNLNRDSAARQESYRRYRDVFDRHHTDAKFFGESFRWYAAHPDIFYKMYDSVLVKLSEAQGKASAQP